MLTIMNHQVLQETTSNEVGDILKKANDLYYLYNLGITLNNVGSNLPTLNKEMFSMSNVLNLIASMVLN